MITQLQNEYILVEKPAIDQLQSIGYTYINGDELLPEHPSQERDSLRDIILIKRLAKSIKRINPWINEDNLLKVIRDTVHIQSPSLIEANQTFYENIVKYMSYEQDLGQGRRSQTVKLIDFENFDNNEFLVVNQFKAQGIKQNIIPDIVIFINGLPIAIIECKSPYITEPMEECIKQLLRYSNCRNPQSQEGCEKLFWYNQIIVSTFGDKARLGTISSSYEHYLEWKDPYPHKIKDNSRGQEVLIQGIFDKRNLLDIIQNFIVFETVQGKTIKKICRYQQFRAVHKTIERVKTKGGRKERGGIIWHTQGSGKSLTMVFLAMKIRRDPMLQKYKLIIITDRRTLDRQITNTFRRCQDETIYHAKSIRKSMELLQKDSGDIVTSMISKFWEENNRMNELNASDKIIVLVDEAHRGHYSELGMNLNIALPNAPKIAFTGTPLIKSQKTTNEFGQYIDTYTIEQAVQDGATIQIIYEGRESNTKVTGDSLDKLFNAYFSDKSDKEKEKIRQRYGTERAVLEAPKRIEMICVDIIKHYQERIQPNEFKALIVTPSRRAAITYKKKMDELNAPESQVVISGLHNDEPELLEYTDENKHNRYIDRFLKPMSEDELCFLIVVDRLLTGFDAPGCQVMYLDKKIIDHNLLQAIARVNRTKTGKSRGYIVDYYGLADYLDEALRLFTKDDVKGALIPLKEELPKLQTRHAKVMNYFKDVKNNDIESCVWVLADDEKRAAFERDFKQFLKSMDIIMPSKEAAPYLDDLKFLGQVNIHARNRYRDDQLNISGCGKKVRKLIEENIYSIGVDPKIEPIAIIAKEFTEYVAKITDPRAKASEIEHAIKHHITVNIENDPEYYKKLSERLKSILQAQHEKWEDLVQLLLDFRDNIEKEKTDKEKDIGLDSTEAAFYRILSKELTGEIDPNETMREKLRSATIEVVEKIKEATFIIDFFRKEDEINTLRRDLKHILTDHDIDDKTLRNKIIDRFVEQAEVKFKAKASLYA